MGANEPGYRQSAAPDALVPDYGPMRYLGPLFRSLGDAFRLSLLLVLRIFRISSSVGSVAILAWRTEKTCFHSAFASGVVLWRGIDRSIPSLLLDRHATSLAPWLS